MDFEETRTLKLQEADLNELINLQSRNTVGTSIVGSSRELMLTIKGYKEFIRINEGDEFEFGRYEYPERNQLNLTPYGALECGLSRQHAKLYLHNDRLYIADMGSTNGTYVRGHMLKAAEPTLIRNGDDILLGRMRIKIQF